MIKTMNLTHKLRQKFVLNKIQETDWEKGNSAPLVIEIDPTAVCDLSCPGCISEDIISEGGSFSKDRLISLGKEFIQSGVKAVILIGGGEPLAHPKAGEFISLLGENDVHIGITTNGSFIDRFIEPISEYSKWTRISVDAATEKTFSILRPAKRGQSKFKKIINNMNMLAEKKTGLLGFSYLIQTEADGPLVKSNVHEIYDAAVLSKKIGCDYFEVKPTYQWRGNAVHSLIKHEQNLMKEAKTQIEALNELVDENFQVLKAITLDHSLKGSKVQQKKNYKKCPSTHLRTTVTPKGVYICPYWRGKQHMKIGDLNEKSFKEVWNGSVRKNVIDTIDISKECNSIHCLRHETNLEAINLKNILEKKENIKFVDDFDRFI